MRLLRLKLMAYGPFTDYNIDLCTNNQGIQLLYGPNEAGKSATLRAITDLLYGIPERTNDNFIHENNSMRIGARISHSDGSYLEFSRRKGRKNTLLDHGDKILDEAILEKYLGGVTRELFETIYGINQFSLVEGGKQLVIGGGEIGQSLFSAGSGILKMNKIVEALDNEAGALFKPLAKNPMINQLTSRFKEKKRAYSEKSLPAKEWITHDKALKNAVIEKEKIENEIAKLTSELSRFERLKNAIPSLGNLHRIREEVDQMGDVVILPPDFTEERRKVLEKLAVTRAAQTRLQKEIQELKSEIDNITLADALLNNQNYITDLFKDSGSYDKANRDLPKLRARNYSIIEEAEAIIKKINPQLTIEHVESLRITEPRLARIRELGRGIEPLFMRQRELMRRKSGLESRIEKAKADFKQLPWVMNPEELRETIEKAQGQGDLTNAIYKAEADIKRITKQVDLELVRLGLWKGNLADLETLVVPSSETVDLFASAFTKYDARMENLHQRLDEQREVIKSLNRQIDAIQASGSVPTLDDLINARKHRDKGWRLIRETLQQKEISEDELKAFVLEASSLIDAFEKSLKDSDEISDRLRNESERAAKLSNLMTNREDSKNKSFFLETTLEQVKGENEKLENEWHELWSVLQINALRPKEMNAWLEKYRQLLLHANELRRVQNEVENLKGMINDYALKLGKCLKELGEETGVETNFDNLITRCRILLKNIDNNNNQRKTLQEKISEFELEILECDHDIMQTQVNIEAWQKEWGNAMKQIWLDHKASPVEADTVLDLIKKFFEKIDGSKELQRRINAILADTKKFTEEVRKLSNIIGADFDENSPDKIVKDLNNRLKDALADDTKLKGLKKQQKQRTDDLRDQNIIIEEAQVKLKYLCDQAKCTNYEELPELEDRSNKFRKNREKIEEIETELVKYTGGGSIHELCMEAESVNADLIPAEIDRLNNQLTQLQQNRSEIDRTIGSEETALKSMDGGLDVSEMAQEAQGILSKIENEVERYARIHISSIILRKEIESYREENQGPILERASDIFKKLTIGSFEKLGSDFDDNDNQVLKGVRPSGERVSVEGMSDGTCDQLYLALRLASIEQRLKSNEPTPLILDDIFVNFDDNRSKATLKVLAEVSRSTQIILFTHHKHLRELAETALNNDTLMVHSLIE